MDCAFYRSPGERQSGYDTAVEAPAKESKTGLTECTDQDGTRGVARSPDNARIMDSWLLAPVHFAGSLPQIAPQLFPGLWSEPAQIPLVGWRLETSRIIVRLPRRPVAEATRYLFVTRRQPLALSILTDVPHPLPTLRLHLRIKTLSLPDILPIPASATWMVSRLRNAPERRNGKTQEENIMTTVFHEP